MKKCLIMLGRALPSYHFKRAVANSGNGAGSDEDHRESLQFWCAFPPGGEPVEQLPDVHFAPIQRAGNTRKFLGQQTAPKQEERQAWAWQNGKRDTGSEEDESDGRLYVVTGERPGAAITRR